VSTCTAFLLEIVHSLHVGDKTQAADPSPQS
jgi:hypothetical protein